VARPGPLRLPVELACKKEIKEKKKKEKKGEEGGKKKKEEEISLGSGAVLCSTLRPRLVTRRLEFVAAACEKKKRKGGRKKRKGERKHGQPDRRHRTELHPFAT